MRYYEPCIQIITIRIKKKDKNEKPKEMRGRTGGEREREGVERDFNFFSSFHFSLRSIKIGS